MQIILHILNLLFYQTIEEYIEKEGLSSQDASAINERCGQILRSLESFVRYKISPLSYILVYLFLFFTLDKRYLFI